MSNSLIASKKDELDNLFRQVAFFSTNLELQAHWVKYLCVRVTGFLEQSLPILFKEYARGQASPQVLNFVEGHLNSLPSPNMTNILILIGSFDQGWRTILESATKEEIKDSINSVVNNRHQIAHGRSIGLTYSQLEKHYKDVIKLLDLIEVQIGI